MIYVSATAALLILGFLLWAIWSWIERESDRALEAETDEARPPLGLALPFLQVGVPPLPEPPPVDELAPEPDSHEVRLDAAPAPGVPDEGSPG